MNNKKLISATQLSMYDNCPQLWYWNYELKLLQKDNDAFLIGSAYHEALEQYHIADCNPKMAHSIVETIKPTLITQTGNVNDLDKFLMFKTMFKKYTENVCDGKIIQNEMEFSIDIDGVPIPLFGKIDRRDEDKIVEYKTSASDFKPEDVRTIQSRVYAYAVWRDTGLLLPVVYHIMHKKKSSKPAYKPQRLEILYTQEEIDEVPVMVKEFYDNTMKGNFEPCKGTHCYWCPYGRSGTNNCKA